MTKRIAAGVAAVVMVLAAALVVIAHPSSAAQLNVMIENYQYSPAALSVHVGDTVTWTNMDQAPHTVTTSSGPEKISSPTLQKGDTFTFTFTKAGTYEYYCAVHPEMKASVTVSDDGGNEAQSPPPPSDGGSPSPHGGHAPPPDDGGGAKPPPPDESSQPPPPQSSPSSPPPAPPPGSDRCSGEVVLNAMADPFVAHFNHAHLEESPGQQVGDATNVDAYVRTHTVLFANMLMPGVAVLQASLEGVGPFVSHFYGAHLEESPSQQAADLLNVDGYVRTHTVLVEAMTAPGTKSATGQC